MPDNKRPKRPRSLKHSLISGLFVLVVLWFSRGYWSGQGIAYLVGAAAIAGLFGEILATYTTRLFWPDRPGPTKNDD